MTTPTRTTSDEPGEQQSPAMPDPVGSGADPAAETADPAVNGLTQALGLVGGDHCAICAAPLAPDQRYCLECGERRGEARFVAPLQTTDSSAVSPDDPRPPRGPRWSAGATLITGIGTLLLALGIGVLIGRSGNSVAPQTNSRPEVVTVGGGSGAAAAISAATTNTTGGPGSGSGSNSHKGHKTANAGAAKSNNSSSTASTASTAAKTVTALPPPTVTVGSKGHGAGYQNGKFTGNFFGGG